MTIKVVKESPGSCVYDSGHFQFKTTAMLGTSVMKEVCAAFESTYELVSKLPWGIVPYPEEGRTKFQAELFESRKAYLATGAPDWSAGVYVRKDKVFRMPFEELGVSLFADPSVRSARPSGYSRNGLVNNLTITHEITHQMMHGYLPYVPAWFSEGTAEYTAHLPYDRGEFDVHGAVQAFKEIKGGGGKASKRSLFRQLSNNVGLISLASLWNCTKDMTGGSKDSVFASPSYYEELASRYYSAHALVFFFMHLDGDGKASRIKKYFDAIHEEKAAWAPYWTMVDAYNKEIEALRPEYEKYQRAMIEFMTLPGVEDLGGGRFKYPPNLSPPKPPVSPDAPKSPDGADPGNLPLKHLGILLDGRTVAQLDRELRDAFYKEGINL